MTLNGILINQSSYHGTGRHRGAGPESFQALERDLSSSPHYSSLHHVVSEQHRDWSATDRLLLIGSLLCLTFSLYCLQFRFEPFVQLGFSIHWRQIQRLGPT